MTVPSSLREKESRCVNKLSVSSVNNKQNGRKRSKRFLLLFLREEYLWAGWFESYLLRLQFVFWDTRVESHIPEIPKRSAWRLSVASYQISLHTVNRNRVRKNLRNGRKPKKFKLILQWNIKKRVISK